MKVALCFIISYSHNLNKEQIWKDWIEPNKDIINIYFHYKDFNAIKSPWIKKYCLPLKNISKTSYYFVVPAYMSILSFAFSHDLENKWFCMLTDSCVPIISPQQFRLLFTNYYPISIFKWKPAYWNIEIHCRGNLKYFNKEYHLANDPWFTLTRTHVHKCILFLLKKNNIYKQVCKGGLANESLFAIILQTFKELKNSWTLINESSTIADWNKMSNATSPHIFKGTNDEIEYIHKSLIDNKYAMFLRKISCHFPDDKLKKIIYENKSSHCFNNQFINRIKSKKNYLFYFKKIMIIAFFLFFLFLTFPSLTTINTSNKCSHWFIC